MHLLVGLGPSGGGDAWRWAGGGEGGGGDAAGWSLAARSGKKMKR
jgi:hypothetical protein